MSRSSRATIRAKAATFVVGSLSGTTDTRAAYRDDLLAKAARQRQATAHRATVRDGAVAEARAILAKRDADARAASERLTQRAVEKATAIIKAKAERARRRSTLGGFLDDVCG